jgi:hypothetical protein
MIEQKSFNNTSNNLEILMIQNLSSPKTKGFLFCHKNSFINATGRPQGHVQKCLQECLYISHSTTVIYSDPLSPNQTDSSAMKNPENKEEDPDDSEPGDQKDIKTEYSFD